jgi:hypothetical protein
VIEFVDTVRILKAKKLDSWGVSVVSDTPEEVPCKIFYSLKLEELKNAEGESVRVTAKIYFEGLYDINFNDRISFTDDFGVEHEFEILDLKPIKDFSNEILYTRVVV